MNVQRTQSLYLVHTKRLLKPHLEKTGVHYDHIKQGAFAPSENDNRIMMKSEPAEISFSGSFRSQEAQANLESQLVKPGDGYNLAVKSPILDTLIQKAEQIFKGDTKSQKKLDKKVLKFANSVIDYLQGNRENASDEVKKFSENPENKKAFKSVLASLNEVMASSKNKETDASKLKLIKKSVVTDALKLIQIDKSSNNFLYKNKKLFKYLGKAADSQIVFSMLYALILTCFLRPASIVALPGQKKNKDDKKYAAAHSIASGVIGYAISLVISSPIATALKKIGKHPEKYLKQDKVSYLGNITDKSFRSFSAFNRAKKIINMCPEVVVGIPKAIATIALIPLILKYVFHLEKKHNDNVAKEQPQQNPNANNTQAANVNFAGGKEYSSVPQAFACLKGGIK